MRIPSQWNLYGGGSQVTWDGLYLELTHKQLVLNCVLKFKEDSSWAPTGQAAIYGLKLSTYKDIVYTLYLHLPLGLNLRAGTETEQK